ncbi:MAG: YdcF family protein [Rhizobiaceae bacterium]|nr:YdcF family protein [Rhizobiaceae bacterium]MCV0407706.1 YdcF family protein [Rhizobiaceae bacterium]
MKGRNSTAGEQTGVVSGPGKGRPAAGSRLAGRLGLAIVVLAVLFMGGFAWFAQHVSRMSTPVNPRNADAIIVLTGGNFRLNAAVDLLRSGKGERLLISGVNPIATRGDLLSASGGDAEVFECCVDVDHAALDTIGNAEESAKWVRRNGYHSVILVTNNYHMPRSLLEMRRLLTEAELQPYPVVNTRIDNGEWMTRPQVLRVLFVEYMKYLAALTRSALSLNAASARPAVTG